MNKEFDLVQWIYSAKSWDPQLEPVLSSSGFKEPRKAWNRFLELSSQSNFEGLFPDFFPRFLRELAGSYDAGLALLNFERFTEKIHDKNYLYTLLADSTELLHALVTLFSGSQVLTDTLLSDPSHFDWLKHPDTLNRPKTKDALMRDFYEMSGVDDPGRDTPTLLRRFKKREYIRIGLRDLLGKVEMQETVEDLSNLADVCLQVAYEYAEKECRRKYGIPFYQEEGDWKESEFTILGMGKLGGRELNYSSDIDLIYIYTSNRGETRPPEGEEGSVRVITNHEYYTKLATTVTRTLNDITAEGNVFRVDLDLRPDGRSGEIVNSLAGCEIYYQSWGRTWERQALLKARVSAGSETLGAEFFRIMEPFIYRRSLDFSSIDEIKSMKEKINRSLQAKKTGRGHIKLGFGGIREIEFIVQAYQLLFGGKDRRLRVANTLEVLQTLEARGFLNPEDSRRLREAYIFLRNLENRVQISYGLQTHVLPEKEEALAVLARKMRYTGSDRPALADQLLKDFASHTRFVGGMFADLFVEEKKQEAAAIATQEDAASAAPVSRELSLDRLQGEPFSDPKRVLRFLESLRDGAAFSHPSERSIQNFYAILPRLLHHCRTLPKPSSAVENLVKYVEAGGARETTLSLLQSNEKFLELLLVLFGSSDFLSQILIKQPDLVDVLMDLESIYRYKPPAKIAEEFQRQLKTCRHLDDRKLRVRRVKQAEELRIGIRYLLREADLMGTLADLSSLADVFLDTVYELAYEELNRKSGTLEPLPRDFSIFGLGKLGGHELNFGSDLDLLLVYEEPEETLPAVPPGGLQSYYVALSQMIFTLTSEMTPAGFAYKIDTDLRPEGSRGMLVLSLKGYVDYFQSRGRIWEQQAMTRARFVAGSRALGDKFLQAVHAFTYRPKLEYGSLIEISRLRDRMEKELAGESKKGRNVKLGKGGLADIEFTAQILQLMHGNRNPRLRQTPTLEVLKQLAACGILDQTEAEQVQTHYLFLRNLECALRLLNQPFTNHLPKETESLAALARLLGYPQAAGPERARALLEDYDRHTRDVRTFYRKTLDTLLRTSL